MKKIALLIMTVIFTACSGDGPTIITPSSSGLPYEVLVVCNKDFWESECGRALFDVLDTDVPALPQSERSFRISQIEPSNYKRMFKIMRNIIEVKIDKSLYTQTKFKFNRDVYSTPQIIMTIQSPSALDFQEYVSQNGQTIIDFFTSAEMNRELLDLQKPNHHNAKFLDSIKAKFGCEMLIPANITGIKSGKDFLWASDMAGSNSNILSFVVYSYPYTGADNFKMENFLHIRDSILKANIPGNRPDRYMTTEHEFVSMKEFEFRERYMQEVRGLWAMENDMMGGPFVSHGVVDEINNRVIMVEAFVYAPGRKKGDLMRKLEAALFSLRLPADKEISNSIHIPEIIIEDSDSTNNSK